MLNKPSKLTSFIILLRIKNENKINLKFYIYIVKSGSPKMVIPRESFQWLNVINS